MYTTLVWICRWYFFVSSYRCFALHSSALIQNWLSAISSTVLWWFSRLLQCPPNSTYFAVLLNSSVCNSLFGLHVLAVGRSEWFSLASVSWASVRLCAFRLWCTIKLLTIVKLGFSELNLKTLLLRTIVLLLYTIAMLQIPKSPKIITVAVAICRWNSHGCLCNHWCVCRRGCRFYTSHVT